MELIYEDKAISPSQAIQAAAHSKESKQMKFTIRNPSRNKTLSNFKLIINLPRDSYQVVLPDRIEPEKQGTMMLTIDAKRLWDNDWNNIPLDLNLEYSAQMLV